MSVTLVSDKDAYVAALADAGSKLVVVDFYAQWCGPCKMISPKLIKMAAEFANVVFLKVDVDENEEVARDSKITAMPTFNFIKDGEVIATIVGANEKNIKEKIQELC